MNKGAFHPFMWPRYAAASFVVVYQKWISPLTPNRCRFYPSCSQYAKEALLAYGLFRGCLMTFRRLIRCHPWNPGGYDPVK